MEKLDTEKKVEHKVMRRFVSHETKLVKSSNDLLGYKLRETWEAMHYKYVQLNQKLRFYIALKINSTTSILMLYKMVKAPEPSIIIALDGYNGYYLYELENAVSENSKAHNYYDSVANQLKSHFLDSEASLESIIANPLYYKFSTIINDKRYELKELQKKD
jgi:hypothetical protein